MAISATITKSRFGTSHDAAYMKIIKTTTDYLTLKSCSHVGVYDSVAAYIQGAQPLYIEKIDYDQEHVEETWGQDGQATPPKDVAYRASRDIIKKIADYSNIINIYEYDFDGGGELTENEIEDLKTLRNALSHVEENYESAKMKIEADTARITKYEANIKETNDKIDLIKKDLTAKKVEMETLQTTRIEAEDKMRSLKEKAEETKSEADVKAIEAHELILNAAEKAVQDGMDAMKALSVVLDVHFKEEAELTAEIEMLNKSIEEATSEVENAQLEKEDLTKEYGNLIAKDANAKFEASSLKKQIEEAEKAKEKHLLEVAKLEEIANTHNYQGS